MNTIFNNVKKTVNEMFKSSNEVTGYVLPKTEVQLDDPEHAGEWVCATDRNYVALVGEVKSGETNYGAIIDKGRHQITVLDADGNHVAEARINNDDTFIIGNKNLVLSKKVSKNKVYFRIEVNAEAKSAPQMSSDLVKKALAHG